MLPGTCMYYVSLRPCLHVFWLYTQKWNCWITLYYYFNFRRTTYCFLQRLYHYAFIPTVQRIPISLNSSPTIIILFFSFVFFFLNISHLNNVKWYFTIVEIGIFLWVSDVEIFFHGHFGHMYIIFGKMSIWFFAIFELGKYFPVVMSYLYFTYSCVNLLSGIWFANILSYVVEKAMAPYSSTLAWKIPWMEKPGRLQSMGSLSRIWLSDFTFTFHFHACSCLENPRDRGAWWAAVYGITQSRTQLKWLSSSSSSILFWGFLYNFFFFFYCFFWCQIKKKFMKSILSIFCCTCLWWHS